jgi:hypothetical protein
MNNPSIKILCLQNLSQELPINPIICFFEINFKQNAPSFLLSVHELFPAGPLPHPDKPAFYKGSMILADDMIINRIKF